MKVLRQRAGRWGLHLAIFVWMLHAVPVSPGQSLVVVDQRIADSEARMTLADLLSQRDDAASLTEAETLVRRILADNPDNRQAQALRATVLLRQGRLAEALTLAERLHASAPDFQPWLLLLADVQAASGHYALCRALYRQALAHDPGNTELTLRFADLSNLWGDFDTVEKHFRMLLADQPENQALRLRLGRVLFSQQRYEEAAGLIRTVMTAAGNDRHLRQQATLALIDVQRMEKDYATALATARQAAQTDPGFPAVSLVEGELLLLSGQPADAEAVFARIGSMAKNDSLRCQALVGVGRSLLRQDRPGDALVPLQKAVRLVPQATAPQFYLALARGEMPEKMTQDPSSRFAAPALSAWADALAAEGANAAASDQYRKALAADPEYFPSQLGLARTLASANRFGEALSLLETLHSQFPESDTVRLTQARVLAWDKQYQASLEQYGQLLKDNPGAQTLRTEAARTAYWGKMPARGGRTYREIYALPVDRLLNQWAVALSDQGKDMVGGPQETGTKEMGGIHQQTEKPPYQLYEDLQQRLSSLRPELRSQIEKTLAELEPEYRQQKAAYLEGQAKQLGHNRQPIRARRVLNHLLEIQPGNEEALVDLAQNDCALGLYGCERETWQRLAQLDPAHNLASYALQRSEHRTRPVLATVYSWQDEQGYGDLARMAHEQYQIRIDQPFLDQYRFTVASHQFRELPDDHGGIRQAFGQSLGLTGVVNEHLTSAAEVLAKWYDDGGPGETLTGRFNTSLNLDDYAQIGLGYRRSEEYANTWALEEDIQADRLRASITAIPMRQIELGLGYEQIFYNDDNDQHMLEGRVKLLLSEHPQTLSLAANVEYRHTAEESQYIYQEAELLDIIHPYWTPQHYRAAGATLEWRHDLSEFFFCGAPLHYYDLKLSAGSDSDDNPYVRSSVEWHYEFLEHWTWYLEGMIHSSEQWRARSAAMGLSYRF